ncbi:MAG: hypothetical protein V3V15_07945 [Sphingorhabdus sp.]
MTKFNYLLAAGFLVVAASAQAGRPIMEETKCPVGGEKFTVTQTASCSTFGGSQDFLLKPQTSCDFVTKLAQCPMNKLPLYKEFSDEEIRKLKGFVKTDAYKSLKERSRYWIAHETEKFLQGGGDAKGLGFSMLFGGLQFDRANTLSDPEYLKAVQVAGDSELAEHSDKNTPYIQLVMSYLDYFQGSFVSAAQRLVAVGKDETVKENKLVAAYIVRLGDCIESSDSKKCVSTDQVVPRKSL